MQKCILLFFIMLLAGCAMTSPMPEWDKITKLEVTQTRITAYSSNYAYSFERQDPQQDAYAQYAGFYQEFASHIPGVEVNFVVKDEKVTAQYRAFVDATGLTAAQIERLRYHYRATIIEPNKKLAVTFNAHGNVIYIRQHPPGPTTRKLEKPVTVTINDNTKQNVSWAAPLMVPAFPLIMIYGCATGRCI
ncbi:hypothetical protein [Enterobacter sp. Bisph1]|uniref:hypothetical protein n=1 Tax=Enterobacter sp. Bisph1 TaxID=1274399 RepID=UPI00057BF1A0|nr:hypothetical protein [Enterobacter sp. Bisph1]